MTWRDHAACLGTPPGLMFPERGEDVRAAKAVCQACEVRDECLQYALDNGETFGIWGGTSERERRRVRAALRLPPRAPYVDRSEATARPVYIRPTGAEQRRRRREREQKETAA